MLKKAREKAKEGLRSVNAETKRYIQTKSRHSQYGGGRGRPRQAPPSSRSAAVSFKGYNDNFEAILNDDFDFTNQFESGDEEESSSVGGEGHQPSSSIAVGEEGWSEEKAFADDSDLFSDPIFSETEHDPLKSRLPATNDVDPLLVTDAPQATSLLHDSDSHLDNKSPSVKTDTITSPESDDTHLLQSRDSVSVLKEHTSETHLHVPEEAGDTEEALLPDSPLFNDDVEYSACPKEADVGSRSGMNIFVTQPSDETHPDQPSHNESEDWLFGERSNQRLEGDKTADLPKSNTPDLPDIDELERNLAVNKLGGVQDLFSSEESPFSSLASSYEGEKAEVLPHISSTTFPSTEGASQIEADHSENELFTSHGGKEESSGLTGDTRPSGGEQDKLTIDKELEALLTPKKKPKMSDSIPVLSTIHPAVDDPLFSPSQQEETRTERAKSQLDSGVFEQSSNSVVMKRTPEREGVTGDDLFQIDEDHFKNDDSTPVLTKRPLTKGSSNIEVSQSKKGLFNTFSAPNVSPPSDSTSSSPPQKKPPGKTGPPPRPAISPKLKHRMIQKQQSGSGSAEVLHQDGIVAKKKIIQPLGHAPQRSEVADHSPTQPESLDSSLSSESATVPPRVPHTDPTLTPVSTKSDDRRIPADDLFLEDNLVSPSSSDKPTINVGDSGEPSENAVLEQGVTKSETTPPLEDDETDYSFLYHLLFAYCLYFYYSLNIFPYLSGFFAGFFVLYLTVGSVFIFYVQTVEKYQSGGGAEDKQQEPTQEFTEHMHVDFDNLCVYKSKRFTATLTYDPATHHPSQRMKAVVHLVDNFELYVRVTSENSHAHTFGLLIDDKTDIRHCTITLVPDEVAKNRKRRWSKKFPIMIFKPPPNTYRVYLFLPHARDKEDWYRRLKHANNGWTSEQLIKKEKKFFAYMENYFPPHSFPRLASMSSRSSSKKSSRHGSSPRKSSVPKVRYSVNQENDDVSKEEVHESVSFKGSPKLQPAQSSSHRATRSYGESSHTDHHLSHTRSVSSSVDSEFEVIPRPPKLTKSSQLQWLNAMAARLCWDIWHEQRWKDWVTTRIQKKLIRVKTPSFMEQLRLTSVDLGNDMPVVEQLREGPKLDLRGIWVYLDVTYSGNFVMTIETKMKLGKENQAEEREGQQMSTMTKNRESGLPQSAPHRSSGQHHSTRRGLSHQHAAKALGGLDDSFEQEIDSGSDDEESATGLVVNPLEEDAAAHSQDHSAHLSGGKRDKIKSMVSRITKKVTSAKIVQKAAQKVSSYPLVLTVVVRGLDGVLAVNIPPPPTDTIWYGFKNPPKLTLVAKPKLGNREVKLSRVSHWIERKLQELVNKKLVLPEMEDLVIPILNSGIPEDKLKPISSDTTPSAT